MTTRENKEFGQLDYKNEGPTKLPYEKVEQGSLSDAKTPKEADAGRYGKSFNIHQNFSDVPVNGVSAAKVGKGDKGFEWSKISAMADNRDYLVDKSKDKGAGL